MATYISVCIVLSHIAEVLVRVTTVTYCRERLACVSLFHSLSDSVEADADYHQGTQESWHNWDILAGRFVSEFGMSVTSPTLF